MEKDWHGLLSQPRYDIILEEDVPVAMRDGIRLFVDIYRPKAPGKFPALVSWSGYGKDSAKLPTNPVWQPSDYVRGTGGHECGEQSYFVPRGYVQVIPGIRGVGKSEGEYTVKWGQDGYDLIEWIAEQSWCNGNVGMLGMSAFAVAQYRIAAQHPPHLKAIFPFEGLTDYYRHHYYHGGIFNYYFQLHISNLMPVRSLPQPVSFKEFTEQELQGRIKALQNDIDIIALRRLSFIDEREHILDMKSRQSMAGKIVDELKKCGVTHIVYLSDSESQSLYEAFMSQPDFTLVPVCREGEAIAIAVGLILGGKEPVVLHQSTGFFESGDSVRGLALDLRFPLLMLINYRGWRHNSPMTDSAAVFIEPILDAWGIKHYLVVTERDIKMISLGFTEAHEKQEPVVILLVWEDEKS